MTSNRHRPDGLDGDDLDTHTLDWVRRVNTSGSAFLSPSMLADRWMVRVSVGVESTERRHLERLLELLSTATSPRS